MIEHSRIRCWRNPHQTATGPIAICLTTALLGVSPTVFAQSSVDLDNGTPGTLKEVIVTAQRRSQTAQSVPFSLQVVTGSQLDREGAAGFQSYLNTISSVGFTQAGNGAVQIGIRGVSNVDGTDYGIGVSTSAVGVYLNDVPIQGAGPIPDLDLYDLSRIEVLKGPQGTLYGEASMGGAIKMILNPADAGKFSAKTQAGISSTAQGGTNDQVRAAVNLPLITDRVALRIVAGHTFRSGYIDNLNTGQRHLGGRTEDTERALLDAKLTDRLSAEMIALHQRLILHDFPEEQTGFGDLNTDIPDHQRNQQDFDLYSLTLKYRLHAATLSSSTAYAKNDREFYLRDAYVGLLDGGALTDFGLAGVPLSAPQGFSPRIRQHAITEEIRAVSRGGGRVSWTLGAFFSHSAQNAISNDTLPDYQIYDGEMTAAAADPASAFNATLASLGATLPQALFSSATDVYENVVEQKYKQYALYGEADTRITPRLSLKTGLRWFTESNSISQFNEALAIEALDFELYGSQAASQQYARIDSHGFAPRVGLSYSIAKDVLVYTLASKGFRSGGPNFTGGHADVPAGYRPDSLWNYELGIKSAWLDHRLLANASVYYIDWKDIQVPAVDPTYSQTYIANAGNAWVKGAELQLDAMPATGWRTGMNLGLLDSRLVSVGPSVSGVEPGVQLPRAPKVTASAYVQYARPVSDIGTAVARFDYKYVGREAIKLIAPPPPGPDIYFASGYSTGDLQLGLERDSWDVYGYVDNLWNERGVLDRTFYKSYSPEELQTVIRPRTIGVRIDVHF